MVAIRLDFKEVKKSWFFKIMQIFHKISKLIQMNFSNLIPISILSSMARAARGNFCFVGFSFRPDKTASLWCSKKLWAFGYSLKRDHLIWEIFNFLKKPCIEIFIFINFYNFKRKWKSKRGVCFEVFTLIFFRIFWFYSFPMKQNFVRKK